MIKSQFILDILDLIVEGDSYTDKLRCQITCLTENEFEHTGVGLFVNFVQSEEACKYKLDQDLILTGIKIDCPELAEGADVTLFMRDGIIWYLDIMAHGESYPITEPQKYTLRQVWNIEKPRQIERK